MRVGSDVMAGIGDPFVAVTVLVPPDPPFLLSVTVFEVVAAAVAGKTAVTTPLFAGLLTEEAPDTVKKLAATPVSVKPDLGVRVMVAV